ncbi:MAG: hypothetical protein QNJ62_07660 [Methyloceanibacter sp.]|nr:hypothetical protein [Methyloceanibacter sp.]
MTTAWRSVTAAFVTKLSNTGRKIDVDTFAPEGELSAAPASMAAE